MAQPLVSSYFNTRKRRASEDLQVKSKVLILENDTKKEILPLISENDSAKMTALEDESTGSFVIKSSSKKDGVVRNLKFDTTEKPKSSSRTRTPRLKLNQKDSSKQLDIRETLLKGKKTVDSEKNVPFAKFGSLSPKKKSTKVSAEKKSFKEETTIHNEFPNQIVEESSVNSNILKTPTKLKPTKLKPANLEDMSLGEIKNKLTANPRLAELRARINKFKDCEERLKETEDRLRKQVEARANHKEITIKKFDKIEVEIPISPQKTPSKICTPTKSIQLSPKCSPQRRLLFEPKDNQVSPIKSSPIKIPAYQRYQSLIESEINALSLPYKYKLLAEFFRNLDTVCAMLYNRKETITFSKVKLAVQELVRKNFTLDHLAQIKTIYPDAFSYEYDKLRKFGTSNPLQYELVISPIIESDSNCSGRNTPDENNILKSASESNMGPSILLLRKKKFNEKLLDLVKSQHENYLLNLEVPIKIAKEKITRWHPDFNVDGCEAIEKAELPQPPQQETNTSVKNVLERAKQMFSDHSRMKKALDRLSDGQTSEFNRAESPDTTNRLNSSTLDTPPPTPTTSKLQAPNAGLKGIPQSLLEKVRAKQAAKALELMTKTKESNNDALKHSRLPELAKIIRGIFVSEKKNVLTLKFVKQKLDDSYKSKLTSNELEEHINLLCKIAPLWITIHNVRNTIYLKIAKEYDMTKIINRLEVLANEKV